MNRSPNIADLLENVSADATLIIYIRSMLRCLPFVGQVNHVDGIRENPERLVISNFFALSVMRLIINKFNYVDYYKEFPFSLGGVGSSSEYPYCQAAVDITRRNGILLNFFRDKNLVKPDKWTDNSQFYADINFISESFENLKFSVQNIQDDLNESVLDDIEIYKSSPEGGENALLRLPLWRSVSPWWFDEAYSRIKSDWESDSIDWSVWASWYELRLKGSEYEWPIGTSHQDAEMSEWVLNSLQNFKYVTDFGFINTALAEKIAELSERTAELSAPEPLDSDLEQGQRGLLFESSDGAVIGLSPERAGDRVVDTADARDSHAECLREAQVARKKWSEFQIDNAMGEALDRYIEALGPRLVDIRPRLLIVRGEKLRRLSAEQGSSDTNAPPIQLDDVINAHNVLVGLDPFLAGIERAVPGPADRPPVAANIDDLKALITTIVLAQIAAQDAVEGLRDVADNVPAGATLDDRRAQTAVDSSGNFVRTAVALVKRHRWAVAAGTVTVPIGVGHWIQSNMDKLLLHFANEPSIVALLHWVATLPLTP